MAGESLEREIKRRVEEMGFEFVELEQAGNKARPILRLYLDLPGVRPGEPGISLEECARVSRALEPFLDAREDLSERYVLEVSSPGVERPLVRRGDWERFAGQEVNVRGKAVLAERARRLQGTLLGLRGDEGAEEKVVLRLEDGSEAEFPLADVDRANLVFRWERKGKGGASAE